jgi:hypothetical protein
MDDTSTSQGGGLSSASGSYDFVESRTSTAAQLIPHDIDPNNLMIETAYTIYQTATVLVSGVDDTLPTHSFKVELYSAPRLADIQAYVDGPDVHNLKADYLVRCPLICFVSLRADVIVRQGSTATVEQIRDAVCAYVNSRSFIAQLTESELLSVIHQFDIQRVETTHDPIAGFWLSGTVRAADGSLAKLQGHSLNIRRVEDGKLLLVPETCVFAADPRDVTIQLRTEE